ncbi:cytochrome P450 [Gautieria morchelliformis]|nr:cytochrome P450 [Gautieria morchelliformis]
MTYRSSGPGCSFIAVDPSHHLGFLWPNPQRGKIGTVNAKYEPYAKAGSFLLPAVSLATPRTIVFVADPEVIKTVMTDRSGTFQKDPQTYAVLHVYGTNIIGSDGPTWKRQKDISRAAFNEGNVVLAWKETCKSSNQALSQLESVCPFGPFDVTEFLKKITLASTSASTFGLRIPYGKDTTAILPPGYQLQFGEALRTACEQIVFRWATPAWARKLPIPPLKRFLSHMDLAYRELEDHLRGLITVSRATLSDANLATKKDETPHNDLLRRLVESNAVEVDPGKRLTDEELVSNMFIFLVAGHETTAHTLAFILGHLALYPDVQAKVFEEVRTLWPDEQRVLLAEDSFEDFSQLVYTQAVFRESLRLFPMAPRLPKVALKEAVLHSRARFDAGPGSKHTSIAVPKGGLVVLDIMATHHNRAYWGEDADEFRPERFIDTAEYRWPREAFLAFSVGGRACIGQRTGQVQSLCILAHIIRAYQVSLPPHLVDLPFEKQRGALLRFWMGASLTPTDLKLTFTRRPERA